MIGREDERGQARKLSQSGQARDFVVIQHQGLGTSETRQHSCFPRVEIAVFSPAFKESACLKAAGGTSQMLLLARFRTTSLVSGSKSNSACQRHTTTVMTKRTPKRTVHRRNNLSRQLVVLGLQHRDVWRLFHALLDRTHVHHAATLYEHNNSSVQPTAEGYCHSETTSCG
jgi:hypothetical protein